MRKTVSGAVFSRCKRMIDYVRLEKNTDPRPSFEAQLIDETDGRFQLVGTSDSPRQIDARRRNFALRVAVRIRVDLANLRS